MNNCLWTSCSGANSAGVCWFFIGCLKEGWCRNLRQVTLTDDSLSTNVDLLDGREEQDNRVP
jgi:hypothetical protein